MWLNIGTPKNHHFSFGTNGKVVGLGVPLLKHFRVYTSNVQSWTILFVSRSVVLAKAECLCLWVRTQLGAPLAEWVC